MNSRPKLKIPMLLTDWILEITGWLLFAVFCAAAVYVYTQSPEKIPTHFNAVGGADAYGDKSMLWYFTGIGALLFIGMSVLTCFPHTFNYLVKITEANAERQYRMGVRFLRLLKLLILADFLVIMCGIRSGGLGTYFLPVSVGVLLSIMAVYAWFSYRYRH